MRTTLSIDNDVLSIAKALAEARRVSLGEAVSYLARRGANMRSPLTVRNGFHVFSVETGTPEFGPDDVGKALAEEDSTMAASFWKPAL